VKNLLVALVGLLLIAAAGPVDPGNREDQELRFTHVDLVLDSGGAGLHAWQVELVDPSGRAKVVGVEGGDDGAWSAAPYYDPAALQGGRIVLAAFSLDGGPRGRQRVARVHLAVQGAAEVPFEAKVQAAADDSKALEDVLVEVKQ
jgi:hypothetical protein